MIYLSHHIPAKPRMGAARRHGYTHLVNSWSAAPSFWSLLARIAPMKKAKDAALPTTTAAEMLMKLQISMRAIMPKAAAKSIGGY